MNFFLIWFGAGAIPAIGLLIYQARENDEITLFDLLTACILSCFGPFWLLFAMVISL